MLRGRNCILQASRAGTQFAPRGCMRRISTRNIGAALAILAGCASLGMLIWPGSAPQTMSLNSWFPIALAVGSGFLASVFIVDKHTALARLILASGGLVLIASGLYFGLTAGGG